MGIKQKVEKQLETVKKMPDLHDILSAWLVISFMPDNLFKLNLF